MDKEKVANLIKDTKNSDLKQLLDVKDSQVAHLRKGERRPSANGLLRLMIMYGVSPDEIATVDTQ